MTALPAADAIVVAAGASTRMGGRDKLSMPVSGRPLLAWTLEALAAAGSVRRVILVAARERLDAVRSLPFVRDVDAIVVPGGDRRQESVAAGLAEARGSIVLVHDGARPFVSPELIDRVATAAAEHGAAIPVVAVVETLKRVDRGRVAETVSREGIVTAQTPQGARRELLVDGFAAYPAGGRRTFTDEAALLEARGVAVVAVAGEATNIKITQPEDFTLAEALVRGRVGPPRVGFGTDTHAFGPDAGLALGGLLIQAAPRLAGHSDGDVVLHAVADALLGAASLGDVGRLFPPTDAATHGISSARLVTQVLADLRAAGWRPQSVDLTITAARPRLGATRLDEMGAAIAGLLGLAEEAVGVKASTGNLLGSDGAGRSISASAIATVVRVGLAEP